MMIMKIAIIIMIMTKRPVGESQQGRWAEQQPAECTLARRFAGLLPPAHHHVDNVDDNGGNNDDYVDVGNDHLLRSHPPKADIADLKQVVAIA